MDRHSTTLTTPQGTPASTSGAAPPAVPKRSFASRLFGYDIFLSFALGPPPRGTHSYASDFARRLRERDFSVFFSEDEAPPGEQLDSTLRAALLRSKSLVVIANRGTLLEPRWVRKEVEEFRKHHPDRPVIPVNVGGALQDPTVAESALEWLGYQGKIWLDESEEAVAAGIANEQVVERLATAPTRAKSNIKWRWVVGGAITMLTLLAIGLGFVAKMARDNANIAEERARLATARQLAAQAIAASVETSATTAYGTVDPQRSVLLALESLKRFQTAEGTKALRDAIARLMGKAPEIRFAKDDVVGDFSLSPDGKSLAIIQNGKAYLRNASAPKSPGWSIPGEDPFAIVFSLDGTRLALFCDDSTLIWEVAAQKQMHKLPPIKATIDRALNPNGSQLIALSEKGLQVWDTSSSSIVREITPPQGSWVKAAISPGGKWLATRDKAGLIQVMDVATGREIGRFRNEDIYDLFLSQDGELLATNSETGVDVWRVKGWRRIAASLPHEWTVQKMAFSLDSRWLTTVTGKVSMDAADLRSTSLPGSAIRVWDLSNQRLVMHVSLAQEGGFAQEDGGKGFAFTSDGDRLVTASPIIAPSPDGNGSIQVEGTKSLTWILLPTDLTKTACSLLTRNLSESEWKTYMGDEPYCLTCNGLRVPEE